MIPSNCAWRLHAQFEGRIITVLLRKSCGSAQPNLIDKKSCEQIQKPSNVNGEEPRAQTTGLWAT